MLFFGIMIVFYPLICFEYISVKFLHLLCFICFSYLVDGQVEREPLVEVVRPSQIEKVDVP